MTAPHRPALMCMALLPAVAGCARVRPDPSFQEASARIEEAVGFAPRVPDGDADSAGASVAAMLEDGLTADEAVAIALLNNPTVQAGFHEIGMAVADLVQAGLLSNPTLSLMLRLPEGGGRTNLEFGIAQQIVDLWQIPVRRKVAREKLAQTVLAIARSASMTAIDARAAYYNALAAQRGLAIDIENRGVATQLLEVARARQRAGAVGELDVNLSLGTQLATELEIQNASLQVLLTKRRLMTLLSLDSPEESPALRDEFPSAPDGPLPAQAMMCAAYEHRLDLLAAQHQVSMAATQVRQEYLEIFPSLTIGLSGEQNARRSLPGRNILADTARASIANGGLTAPDIQSRAQRDAERRAEIDIMLGPSIDLTLPIFDQNQAQISRARSYYDQQAQLLINLERTAAQEVLAALDRVNAAWKIVRLYEERLLPQAQRNLDLSRESYELGRAPLLVTLDAQRSLLSTRRAHVTALQMAAVSIPELERATGRPLAALLAAIATRPAEESSVQ